MADYALPLPLTIIAEMLGVPMRDRQKFTRWTKQMPELRLVHKPEALRWRRGLVLRGLEQLPLAG